MQRQAVRMLLSRLPQQVSNCLAPLSSHFKTRPQGQHFRILCWLLVMLILVQGSATLKNLTRQMPCYLHYWTVLRMVKAGYWDASALITELAQTTLYSLLPPADGILYLIGDKIISGKTGMKQPLAAYTRMNNYQQFTFGISLLLLIAQWGHFRIPLAAAVLNPKKKGDQNIQFRQMLRRFEVPSWTSQVIVLADAGFASKDNLRLIIQKQWHYVFAFPRTWKLADGTHLRDLARHLPKLHYRRVASYKPDQRRKDYWVYARHARLHTLGDVTILLSKQRRNDGLKNIKLIVTNLDNPSASAILNAYARRWAIEVTIKELKSGLHLGQMQVTGKENRVRHAMLFPVLAYLLLLRLYGSELEADKSFSLFTLKHRFMEDAFKERLDRSEHKWRKKLDQLRVAA
ncbi:MAG: transposase [Acidobacteria bacterium]|nr:transposase [Acidobacteriota bacterium]